MVDECPLEQQTKLLSSAHIELIVVLDQLRQAILRLKIDRMAGRSLIVFFQFENVVLMFLFGFVVSSLVHPLLNLKLEAHHIHVKLSQVHQWRALVSNRFKVCFGLPRVSLVDAPSVDEKQKLVKLIEDFRGWLVNGGDYRAPFIGESSQKQDHLKCRRRVQPCGWLIQEYHGRVSNEFDADGCSFPFTTGDSFFEVASDFGVAAIRQTQLIDEGIDSSLALFLRYL